MKKIKLLKIVGCIALVATPVIVAPIIMSTSCAATDPVVPNIEVTSIEGIDLWQKGVPIMAQYGRSALARYETSIVQNNKRVAKINLSIEIYFYINGDSIPVKYSEIKDKISLDLICKANGDDVESIFEILEDTVGVVNQKVTDSVNSTVANKFCGFDSSTAIPPAGSFVINGTSKAIISYGIKGATDSTVTISFME